MKRSATTPNIQRNSTRLLDGQENGDIGEDEDDDEETLQLQLAAIEAKLKLKKLKQNKARMLEVGSDVENDYLKRPSSVASKLSSSRQVSRARGVDDTIRSRIEVPLSPSKRPPASLEPRSPSRVLLGIDKGWKGDDVSLGRSSSVRTTGSRLTSRSSKYDSTRSTTSSTTSVNIGLARAKSFSERMKDGRTEEALRTARQQELQQKRSSGFKLDAAEIEGFRQAAEEEAKSHLTSGSPERKAETTDYGRDAVLQACHENKSTGLKRSNTTPSIQRINRSAPSNDTSRDDAATAEGEFNNKHGGDAALYDPFSQLHLSTRILPHSYLTRTLSSAEPMRIPYLLRNIIAPDFELPSFTPSDYVVFGIIASKSNPRNHMTKATDAHVRGTNDWEKKWDDGSQNDKKFMVMILTDLVWTIDLYLFSTSLPRYHRLSPGTLIAILNPGIMAPKSGQEDTGKFSLTLNSGEDTILEIGTAKDLGFCKTVKKDGKECGQWVDARKSEFCDWHIDFQVRKTQAGRMGLNSSASSVLSGNRFGGGGNGYGLPPGSGTRGRRGREGGNPESREKGLLPNPVGKRYDNWTQSNYYISSSGAPSLNSNGHRNKPKTINGDDDDPFLAEGSLSRDRISKSERLRKRLATEQSEREIARKLGESDLGRGRSAAGGEYLRKRSNLTSSSSIASTPTSRSNSRLEGSSQLEQQSVGSQARSRILNPSNDSDPSPSGTNFTNTNGKRSAENVRLSPVKRKATDVTSTVKKVTRFITEKGIREAGRESLPAVGLYGVGTADNEDDDDLDIV